MKKNYWIICFFILWLVLGLSTIPASWAIYIAQKMLPNWQVDNVSGNFWQGSAQKSQLLIGPLRDEDPKAVFRHILQVVLHENYVELR